MIPTLGRKPSGSITATTSQTHVAALFHKGCESSNEPAYLMCTLVKSPYSGRLSSDSSASNCNAAGFIRLGQHLAGSRQRPSLGRLDRKSGGEGKRVSVRVDLGGCCFIKKK